MKSLLMIQVLIIGTGIRADSNVDSHEIDYIPKLKSDDNKKGKFPDSIKTSVLSTSEDVVSILGEILKTKDSAKQSDERQKSWQGSSTHTALDTNEMQHQTYSKVQSTSIPMAHQISHDLLSKVLKSVAYTTNNGDKNDEGKDPPHLSSQHETVKPGAAYSVGPGNQYGYYTNGDSWDADDESETRRSPKPVVNLAPYLGPRFDRSLPRAVTVNKGERAVLACKIIGKTNRPVIWMREDTLNILSHNNYSHTTINKISIDHHETGDEDIWKLVIDNVTEKDAGRYECQVATKPILSFIVNLKVVVPKAEIVTGEEIFVHPGSLINLTCVVTHGSEKPVFVYWYHYNKILDYESRGGVTVSTIAGRDTVSYLVMQNANANDSGIYACKPSVGDKATTMLHVLKGEKQAAMQVNSSCGITTPPWSNIMVPLAVAIWQLSTVWKTRLNLIPLIYK